MKLPKEKLRLEFASLELYDSYIVSTIDEGILIDMPEKQELFKVFDTHYANEPFIYVSNRKYDYTVNPTSYLSSQEYIQLQGMAVICYSRRSYDIALFEKAFYKRPFQVFYSFEECYPWIESQLAK